ncbi:MAG TPA: OsmC family peroxiredoxin [Xanthobacteraceae bacterium]
MIRKAKAVWRGTGRAGGGNLSTDSGVRTETPYSFETCFENEKGTNPEVLIAAAHAGCFTWRLHLVAGGYTPAELTTEAAVTLEPEGQGFHGVRVGRGDEWSADRRRFNSSNGAFALAGEKGIDSYMTG